MKSIRILALCAMGAMVLASCSNMTSNKKRPASVTADDVRQASYMIGYNFGQFIDGNNMGALDVNQIVKGIKDACNGKQIDQEEFMQVMDGYMEKVRNAVKQENIDEAEAFFAKNAKAEGVQTTESGIQYKIVRQGNGVFPSADNQVKVNYEGTLFDGEVFDSSYERGEPVTFSLAGVIPGWSEGMQLIDEGGEILLWIPSELAYGEYGAGGKIGPSKALKFRIELLEVVKPADGSEE